ncbi:cupin domain-containing protein [candidate division KSB1 bacterium]|nr:cupin domain-containing protein [candidate division KSB1 bacterium]
MPLYKQPKAFHFTPENPVEKHFHDHDETWIITSGKARAYMIDRDGKHAEFTIEAGDIWMVEAGVEHGCDPEESGIDIFPFPGTIPVGSHDPGHYYMEKEQYLPTLVVKKSPLDRYK